MNLTFVALQIISGLLIALSPALAKPEIRVITDRTESHLKPIFDLYKKKNDVEFKVLYVESGILARMRAYKGEADIMITNDATLLDIAKDEKLLTPFSSKAITQAIPAAFRDAERFYTILSYRARVIFYSKARVKPDEIATYDDLTNPKWKGRVCIRSGYHNYNLSLFSQMAADKGLQETKEFLTGLKRNLAKAPSDNDRGQARAVWEEKCDISIMNSYYMGIMLLREDQKQWANALDILFPNQEKKGSYIMRSGAGLVKTRRKSNAVHFFLEFLTTNEAQNLMQELTFEYALNANIPLPYVLKNLGASQVAIKDGRFKYNLVDLAKANGQRENIIKLLNEMDFDGVVRKPVEKPVNKPAEH